MASWERIAQATHNLVLALRAIERFIWLPASQELLKQMPESACQDLLRAVASGDYPAVKNIVFSHVDSDLDTVSFVLLRERASRLRLNAYNKMSRAELIFNIRKIESHIRDQVRLMKKPKIGYIDGDGI